MYNIENEHVKLSFKQKGAELVSIFSKKNNKEYLWQGDPAYWSGQSPVLFPFIGCLKDGEFVYNGQSYSHPKHGFFRKYEKVTCLVKEANKIVFEIKSDEETFKIYPFHFEFQTSYTLKENQIEVKHIVKNLDKDPMYFSIGAHPAFNCSLQNSEIRHDACELVFEKAETENTWDVNLTNGLIKNTNRPSLENQQNLALDKGIFDADALIYKNLKSKRVTLKNKLEGNLVTVDYNDFEYIAFWTVPNAPFVCIEPWLGIADSEDHNKDLIEKEGIIKLDGLKEKEVSYQISILH